MFNMENVTKTATRITLTSRTLIDLIVTTRKDSVGITGVFPLGVSDHNLIYATLRLQNKRPSPTFITTRNYKRLDEERFRNNIETAPFHVASVTMSYGPASLYWTAYEQSCGKSIGKPEMRLPGLLDKPKLLNLAKYSKQLRKRAPTGIC